MRLIPLVLTTAASSFCFAQEKAQDLKTVIQSKLACCSVPIQNGTTLKVNRIDFGPQDQVTLNYSSGKTQVRFHLLDLYKDSPSSTGMELAPDGRFIQFHLDASLTRVVRFKDHASADEALQAFIKLQYIEQQGRKYLSRQASIDPSQQMLLEALRPEEKKDEGDSTVRIQSSGEGWMDGDSIPVGEWSFYAKNKEGKEYLFKKGRYARTTSKSFRLTGVDLADAGKRYGVDTMAIKNDYAASFPFAKTGEWQYFHPNGKLWKKVRYTSTGIPAELSEMLDENGDAHSLTLLMKSPPDETIVGEVTELDPQGNKFKRLIYNTNGILYAKTLYSMKGIPTKTLKAMPGEPAIDPNHF